MGFIRYIGIYIKEGSNEGTLKKRWREKDIRWLGERRELFV